MLFQQRSAANMASKNSKALASHGSLPSPVSLVLPPSLTSDTLSSLIRLPIESDCLIRWKRFGFGSSEERKDVEDTIEALMELAMAESKNRRISINGSNKGNNFLFPHSDALWALERSLGGSEESLAQGEIVGLWHFELVESNSSAESSSSANSEARRYVDKCRETVKHRFARMETRKETGQCQTKNFYSSESSSSDPLSLLPVASHAPICHHLIKALEEHYLSRWIWTESKEIYSSAGGGGGGDEEEEGAIEDGNSPMSQPSSSDSKIEYWLGGQRCKKRSLSRFRDGVILFPSTQTSTQFNWSSQVDHQATCLTLRCFANDKGHIYLETRPQTSNKMEHVSRGNLENRLVLLGPNGMQARVVERMPVLQWPCEGTENSDGQRDLMECKKDLLRKLEVRGVRLEDLEDEWLICETNEKIRFLWPSKLCYLLPRDESNTTTSAIETSPMRLANKPLGEVAMRAKGLVKESIGLRESVEDEDAIMLDAEVMEMDEEDEDIDDEGDEENEEDEEEDEEEEEVEEEDAKKEGNDSEMQATIVPIKVEGENGRGSIASANSVTRTLVPEDEKRNSVGRDEDEPDLWGTFGFGSHVDDDGKDHRRQSVAGLDEGAFGLITEDDFSFFDEAAMAAGSFDDMDEDPIQHSREEDIGDSTVLATDNDYNSEVATSNSTFIDPPSLPGFTPSSFSATSPAVGGLNAKTPRTPFSPNQDMIDANVAIEGEVDTMFHDPHRYHPQHHISLPSNESNQMVSPDDRIKESTTEKLPWSPQNRGDLTSKYEQGKFALPLVPNRKKGEGEEGGGSQEGANERETGIYPRSRLNHRSNHGRRLSLGKLQSPHSGNGSRKLRLGGGLLSRRAEEEISDLDATIDGTISERSSLMDEDSDDDDLSSTSEDASEVEESMFKERLEWLRSSRQHLKNSNLGSFDLTLQPSKTTTDIDANKEAEWNGLLKLMTDIPQARSLVSSIVKPSKEMISRSVSRELFPFAFGSEQNKLGLLFQTDSSKGSTSNVISVLEPPKIVVGCQGSIASMESTALPFWEKLGLSCVSGPKDIVAFALHCSNLADSWIKEILAWFTALEWTFKKTGLGSQVLAEDGLLALHSSQTSSIAHILTNMALQSEQWTDTLESLLSRFEGDLKEQKFVVIYAFVVTVEPRLMWIFLKLESDLRRLVKGRWNIAPELINVRAYPWTTIPSSMSAVQSPSFDLRRISTSVYDSLLIPVSPNHNQKSHLPILESNSVGIVHPSFTIAPTSQVNRTTARFQLKWKTEPFNLTDTGLLLHVGYHMGNQEGAMTFVAIMDESGHGHFVTGWRRSGSIQGEVEQVWKQIQSYTLRARVLWRIVVCSDRQMPREEVKQWSLLVKQEMSSTRALDVTIACFDTLTAMALVIPRNGKDKSGIAMISTPAKTNEDSKFMHYIDARQADYAIFPPFRVVMDSQGENGENDALLPLQSSVIVSISKRYNGSIAITSSNQESSLPESSPQHYWLHLLQVHNSPSYDTYHNSINIRNRIELITKSYHQLAFIARERFLLDNNLPWHLAILCIFCQASPSSFS